MMSLALVLCCVAVFSVSTVWGEDYFVASCPDGWSPKKSFPPPVPGCGARDYPCPTLQDAFREANLTDETQDLLAPEVSFLLLATASRNCCVVGGDPFVVKHVHNASIRLSDEARAECARASVLFNVLRVEPSSKTENLTRPVDDPDCRRSEGEALICLFDCSFISFAQLEFVLSGHPLATNEIASVIKAVNTQFVLFANCAFRLSPFKRGIAVDNSLHLRLFDCEFTSTWWDRQYVNQIEKLRSAVEVVYRSLVRRNARTMRYSGGKLIALSDTENKIGTAYRNYTRFWLARQSPAPFEHSTTLPSVEVQRCNFANLGPLFEKYTTHARDSRSIAGTAISIEMNRVRDHFIVVMKTTFENITTTGMSPVSITFEKDSPMLIRLEFVNCRFLHNRGVLGGAMFVRFAKNTHHKNLLLINDSVFEDNLASDQGGAVLIQFGQLLDSKPIGLTKSNIVAFSNVEFTRNTAGPSCNELGGAVHSISLARRQSMASQPFEFAPHISSSTVFFENCTFAENCGWGAVYTRSTDMTFSGNR